MKVNDRNRGVIDPRVGAAGIGPQGQTDPPAGSDGTDQVSVSDAARELARLKGEVGDPGEVDSYRVATLQGLTQQGRYTPDLRGAAEGFLRQVAGDLLA